MNREILFRGVNFQKEWVYGDLFHSYANDDVAIAYYREGSKTPTFDAVSLKALGSTRGSRTRTERKFLRGIYSNILEKEKIT